MVIPADEDAQCDHHGFALSVHTILERYAYPELSELAEWVYLLNPCTVCRNDAVEWLRAQNRFSPALEAEYVLDARHQD